jgi:hypothetical protein
MKVVLSDTNPNETTGGGGCLVCGSTKNPDQRGPFLIVNNDNEMESNISPRPVVCATCLHELNEVSKSEALSAGEPGEVPSTFSGASWPIEDDEEVPSL